MKNINQVQLGLKLVLITGIWFILNGCAERIAPEKMKMLKNDISAIQVEIGSAEAEEAKYEGGLILALIKLRLETLRQTLAMLQKREKSWLFGISLKFNVDGKPYVPPTDVEHQIKNVEEELKALEGKISKQQAEALYSGGLIQAMSLATLATMRFSYAMLDHRRLALRYGLPQYVPPENLTSKVSYSSPPVSGAKMEKDFEIISVDMRVTESNDVWWKFAWRLTLENKSESSQSFDAKIEFQDREGFVIADDDEHNLMVSPNSQQTFTGYELITAQVAGNVARVNAKVRKR
jgi:hypothetical protein